MFYEEALDARTCLEAKRNEPWMQKLKAAHPCLRPTEPNAALALQETLGHGTGQERTRPTAMVTSVSTDRRAILAGGDGSRAQRQSVRASDRQTSMAPAGEQAIAKQEGRTVSFTAKEAGVAADVLRSRHFFFATEEEAIRGWNMYVPPDHVYWVIFAKGADQVRGCDHIDHVFGANVYDSIVRRMRARCVGGEMRLDAP